jgi:hypothetical protein
MSYFWVPSPNVSAGRPGPIRWVVWHDTEGNETNGAALGVARGWFGIKSSQVSAHVVCDGLDVVECVKPQDRAWHCGPNGNGFGYGIEIVGKASQSVTDWRDPYSVAALQNAARWVLSVPALADLPRRFLTNGELASGMRGHITHAQVTRVLGGTSHTDPGPNFPFDVVTAYLNGDSAMEWNDRVIPDYSKNPPIALAADVTLGWTALHAGQAADRSADAAARSADAAARLVAVEATLASLVTKVDGLSTSGGTVDLGQLADTIASLVDAKLAARLAE